MKTLPEEMVRMLEEHCEKLQNVEEVLYNLATGNVGEAQDLPTPLEITRTLDAIPGAIENHSAGVTEAIW